jgi:hypothetical protein
MSWLRDAIRVLKARWYYWRLTCRWLREDKRKEELRWRDIMDAWERDNR